MCRVVILRVGFIRVGFLRVSFPCRFSLCRFLRVGFRVGFLSVFLSVFSFSRASPRKSFLALKSVFCEKERGAVLNCKRIALMMKISSSSSLRKSTAAPLLRVGDDDVVLFLVAPGVDVRESRGSRNAKAKLN